MDKNERNYKIKWMIFAVVCALISIFAFNKLQNRELQTTEEISNLVKTQKAMIVDKIKEIDNLSAFDLRDYEHRRNKPDLEVTEWYIVCKLLSDNTEKKIRVGSSDYTTLSEGDVITVFYYNDVFALDEASIIRNDSTIETYFMITIAAILGAGISVMELFKKPKTIQKAKKKK